MGEERQSHNMGKLSRGLSKGKEKHRVIAWGRRASHILGKENHIFSKGKENHKGLAGKVKHSGRR